MMLTIRIIHNYFDITPKEILNTVARYKKPIIYEFINRKIKNEYMKTIINILIIFYF